MKKLLAFLGAISLVGSNAALMTACTSKREDANLENLKRELSQYVETPFFASSSNATSEEFATMLSSRLNLGSYKLAVKNDATFVQPKIIDNNHSDEKIAQANMSTILQQQDSKKGLDVVNGTASVNILKKDKEEFNVKIQWVTNELILLKNTVNKIDNMSSKLQNINLPLPPLVKGVNITFADLYTFIGLLPLPEKEIMEIDLTKINEPDFLEKFDTLLNIIAENLKTLQFDISGYLNKDISFNQILDGKGTVKDLLHNMAPDLIALLQWFVREGKEKIESTHNTVLPLIQYLFSPVNTNLKENIKVAFGKTGYFYQNTNTNLDSLIFHTLTGYRSDYKETDSKYRLSFFVVEINQNKVKLLSLKPTLLIGSILDIFAAKGDKRIDAVNTNLVQPKTWQEINTIVTSFLPKIEFFLGPQLMNYAGSNILRDFGISNTELKSNDVTMSAGTVKLQFKTPGQDGKWENFRAIIDDNNTPNLTQILNAVDFKLSFTNIKFKVTTKINDKIAYETSGESRFDLWLSDNYE
ncbi:MAG: lipoprotein [Spiroplasma sp. hy2]|uniref:lipoprotein n=1 Tax=Spiroplasma sp. hy2 TaxID=2490850 RepID=UPI00384630DF